MVCTESCRNHFQLRSALISYLQRAMGSLSSHDVVTRASQHTQVCCIAECEELVQTSTNCRGLESTRNCREIAVTRPVPAPTARKHNSRKYLTDDSFQTYLDHSTPRCLPNRFSKLMARPYSTTTSPVPQSSSNLLFQSPRRTTQHRS